MRQWRILTGILLAALSPVAAWVRADIAMSKQDRVDVADMFDGRVMIFQFPGGE